MLKNLTFQQKLLVFITGVVVLMGVMLSAIGYLYFQKHPIDDDALRSIRQSLGIEAPRRSKAKIWLDAARQNVKRENFQQAILDYTTAIKEPYEYDTTEKAFEELAKLRGVVKTSNGARI